VGHSIAAAENIAEAAALLREHKIGFLAYSPMQAGILTGKFDMARVAKDDWRRNTHEYKEPNLSINLDFVEALRPIAEIRQDRGAIAWRC
jgi:aryl-alcohol dehydrogenase-like predicted oxidoreductase